MMFYSAALLRILYCRVDLGLMPSSIGDAVHGAGERGAVEHDEECVHS